MRVLFALLALAASVATVSAQGWTGPNFYIVGNDAQANYNFSINGVIVNDPAFNLTVGTTYKFILNASLPNHPFGFSTSGAIVSPVPIEDFTPATQGGVTTSGACTAGAIANSWFTTLGNETNPCIISFTPPTNVTGQSVYYRCAFHPNMVGTLTAVAAGGAATTVPPTTPAPSGNGTTAPPTTTPAPTGSSSSTGKGSGAAVLVPGAAVFIIAAINALFA